MPSFKAKQLQNAVKDAGVDLKSARDQQIFYVFKLAIWQMHKSLLRHIPRKLPKETIQSEAEAIWEINRYINKLYNKKPLKDKLTDNAMKKTNKLFNEAISFAGTVVKLHDTQNSSGSRILRIYQLCDKLKEIFDFLEGEDIECASIDPIGARDCSFDAIIRINYKQEALIREKINKLQIEVDDRIKFCFCKDSILKWYNHLSLPKNNPSVIDLSKIELFEEAITELKIVFEIISYGELIGNKLEIHGIDEKLNIAASQIGEAATIYKTANPDEIQRYIYLLANFTDQLRALHEHLRLSTIDCRRVLT